MSANGCDWKWDLSEGAFLTSDYSAGYADDFLLDTQLQLGVVGARAFPGTVSTV